jgi:hypothetical protein
MGNATTASGNYSTAMGELTKAESYISTAIGRNNVGGGNPSSWINTDPLFEIGNGTDGTNSANAVTVLKNGNVGLGTANPERILHLVGANSRVFIEASSSNPEVNFKNSGDPTTSIWSIYKNGSTGDLQFYQNGNRLTIQKNTGNVGIGTTSPGYLLEVNGTAGKPGGGSWSNSSDIRLKDIKGDYLKGLEAINQLRPIRFRYKEDNPRGLSSDIDEIGFVAQEVKKSFPEAVSEGEDGYLDFNMHSINVAMVNAVKELSSQNVELKNKIKNQEARIKKLEKQSEDLLKLVTRDSK